MKTIVFAGALVMGALVTFATPGTVPILDHIVLPREAIDLCSPVAWQFAAVSKGTKWDNPAIKWQTVKVPARRYWNGIGSQDPKATSDAYFRRTFDLTEEQAKKGGALFFELLSPHGEVRLNGKLVHAEHQIVGSLPVRVDVTGALRAGSNELAVRLFRNPTKGHLVPATSYMWAEGPYGISRPVHLELFDHVSIADAFIVTKVFPKKVWTAHVTVTNRTAQAVEVEVGVDCHASLRDARNDETTLPVIARSKATKQSIPPHGAKVVTLSFPWKDAKLWTPDTPHLYYAKFELCGRLGEATLPKRMADGTTLPKRTADGTTLPKRMADGRVGSPSRPSLDALRVRFGFREIGWEGRQLTLNGNPMLLRRETFGFGKGDYDVDAARRTLAHLKKSGYNSSRLGTEFLLRDARLADEEGYLLSPLPQTGGPYERWDSYWPLCSNLVTRLVTTFRNHPSISHWSLFNEFGPKFGVPVKQSPKTAAIGAWAMKLDPTRFWVSTGDFEMSAAGADNPGPTKMRSLHYPINLGWGLLPTVAYWLANDGETGSWGVDYKKPVGISEDLFHGMNDNPMTMGQWYGDEMFTPEGYIRAWRRCLEMFVDGYYYSGLSEWNPWATDPLGKYNLLYKDGPLMPDFAISRRHPFPNVAAGGAVEDRLFVFNQTFVPVSAVLTRTDAFGGEMLKTEKTDVTLPPGGRFTGTLAFRAPEVKGARVKPYTVSYALVAGTNTLARRTFAFNVIPQVTARQAAKKAVLLDYAKGGSPVRDLFAANKVFTEAADALAAAGKTGPLLVTGAVPAKDARAIDAWVFKGGRATLLAGTETGWLPVSVVEKRHHNYAWRRTAGFLKDLDESIWSLWRPDGLLATRAMIKDSALDLDVLLDNCQDRGFQYADVLRIHRNNGGSWLVSTLPIETAMTNKEPAAAYLAIRLLARRKIP